MNEQAAGRRGRIAYLCLQATREGQASHAHVHEIVGGLRELGWEVDLHQPDYAASAEDPGLWPRLREFVRVQAKLMARLSSYDLLYVRSHFAAFPTVLYGRLRGIRIVREINGTFKDLFQAWPWTRPLAPVFRWIMRSQLRWSDALITVTQGLADWVREEGARGDVHVVPNAADVEHFRPEATTDRELPDRFVIFFGALAPWQGIETLLAAVQHRSWPDSVSLVIAGDGALRHEVQEAASGANVLYLGRVPYEELPGIVSRSLVGLSPQGTAGGRSATGLFPLKVFETMASGVPVIVTDHPGQAHLVRSEECGLVVPPDDPPAIAAAVRRLANEETTACRQGRRGREATVNRHSWRRRARQTDDILRVILASTTSTARDMSPIGRAGSPDE